MRPMQVGQAGMTRLVNADIGIAGDIAWQQFPPCQPLDWRSLLPGPTTPWT